MSALRINLLPAYIAEMQRTKVAIAGFSALLVAAVAGTLFYYTTVKTEADNTETAANEMEQKATTATSALNAEKAVATELRSKIQPIKDRVDFVKQVQFYNTWVQKIYRRAAKYTNRDIEYASMSVNRGTLTMTGHTPSVDALSRYLISFYANPDVMAVSISAPPGWNRPSQSTQATNPLQAPRPGGGFDFTVNATLLNALQVPQLPASLLGPPEGATAAPVLTPGGGATTPGGMPGGGAAPAAAPMSGPATQSSAPMAPVGAPTGP